MNLPTEKDDLVVTSWDNILKASYENVEEKIPRKVPEYDGYQPAVIGIYFASLRDFASAVS